MTVDEQAQVAANTQTLLHMLSVLERLTLLDDATLEDAVQHTRWAIRRLTKHNWRLSL